MGALRRVWAWLEPVRRSPRSVAVVVAALLIGAIAGWPAGEAGFNYTWRDPAFCDDCHVHDYANRAYFRSVHAGVTTCHDCHRVPIRHYPRNLFRALFDRPQSADDIDVPEVANEVCGQCHARDAQDEPLSGPMPEAIRRQVVRVDDSPLHALHLEETKDDGDPITCMDCHGASSNRAHRFESTTENCIGCHADRSPSAGRLVGLPCRECHFQGFVGDPDA